MRCFRCDHTLKKHTNHTRDGHNARDQRCKMCPCKSFASYSAEFIRVACKVLRSTDQGVVSRLEALMARWTYLSKTDPTLEKGLTLGIMDLRSLFQELRNDRRNVREVR